MNPMKEEAIQIIRGDKNNTNHMEAMLDMLDEYMQDPMGKNASLEPKLREEVRLGLMKQENYRFFLAYYNGSLAGMANCFVNFSTFKAKQLLNIHDFSVSPKFRRKGIGEALMLEIFQYSMEHNFCRVSLEVRDDNPQAQNLYKKLGFDNCNPPMYFWEKNV